jgi:hypothetical protein
MAIRIVISKNGKTKAIKIIQRKDFAEVEEKFMSNGLTAIATYPGGTTAWV